MRVVVIGGTGHVGTYLVPRLAERGHEVTVISRGRREPYRRHAAWKGVAVVHADRDSEEREGTFGERVAEMQPDVVVDLICFRPQSAEAMFEALYDVVGHYLCIGSIWAHGPSAVVPTTEEQPRRPFGDYGANKALVEQYLLRQARTAGFPATILHPGHIVGEGWVPINPAGNRNLEVYERLARGDVVTLPNLGMETLHHVHADDVAAACVGAIDHWSLAVGESFHVVSPAAVTLEGYAEAVARWFGRPANLSFLAWDEWLREATSEDARLTWDHIAHSPNCSIAKARRLLGYEPRYTSLEAVYESLRWLVAHGELDAPPLE